MPKVINISADAAFNLKELPSNTVLISINEETGELYKLKLDRNSSRILTVRFSDVTAPTEYQGKTWFPIDTNTTLKILNFININKGKDIFIHCARGKSRSAAIALYLHLFEGYELKEDYWRYSDPNKFIMGSLIIERHRKMI